jgi:regulator of cell morphogenesis and NO signaling
MTLGELAASRPRSTRVLFRHGLDYCCGGARTLEEACRRRGLAPEAVLREVEAEPPDTEEEGPPWTERSQADLIAHLLSRHHAPLRAELVRLQGLAVKVLRVHGAKDPARLAAVAETFAELKEELEPHLEKEERVLFPWLLSGRPVLPEGPLARMTAEHAQTGQLLARLRALTCDYAVPEGACSSWRALWGGLEVLDRDLHEHIHLENNVLFRRAASTP